MDNFQLEVILQNADNSFSTDYIKILENLINLEKAIKHVKSTDKDKEKINKLSNAYKKSIDRYKKILNE